MKKLLACLTALALLCQCGAALCESDAEADGQGGEDMLFFATTVSAPEEKASDPEADTGAGESEGSYAGGESMDDISAFFSTSTPSADTKPEQEQEEAEEDEPDGTPVLAVTLAADPWTWMDGRQTAQVVLTNNGDGTARNAELTLTQVTGQDGRPLGNALFYKEGKTILSNKKQAPSITLEKLRPGDSVSYEVGWVPSFNLISVNGADMGVSVTLDGKAAADASIHVDRIRSHPGAFDTIITGQISVGHVITAMLGLAAVLFLLAWLRSRKWNQYRNTWVYWPKNHHSEE